jgi:hypothetical protein
MRQRYFAIASAWAWALWSYGTRRCVPWTVIICGYQRASIRLTKRMPAPEDILVGLAEIANSRRVLAIVWHVYFAMLAAGLAVGMRPTKSISGVFLALPLFSVGILAWLAGNPFNGTVFILAAAILISIALRFPRTPIKMGSRWMVISGALMFIFGWAYPHFLDASSYLVYVYSAPTGLIPCPTLSIIIGSTLIVDGLGSRAWSLVLGATGIFYGAFGAFVLGVTLDLVLLICAALLTGMVLVSGSGRLGQSDMATALKAGIAYFMIVFAAGFALGTLRVLALAPHLGSFLATVIELPVMLAVSWFACRWIVGKLSVPRKPILRLVMGGFAFSLLIAGELALGIVVFWRTPFQSLENYRTVEGSLGLLAQIAFGAFPIVQMRLTDEMTPPAPA